MYIRPDSVPRPTTWHTFQASDLDGTPTTYEIRDLIDDEFDKAVDFMTKFYMRDEPVSKVLNVLDNPALIEENIGTWRKCQEQKVPLACYEIKTGQMVGVNFLCVASHGDLKGLGLVNGKENQEVFQFYERILREFNGFKTFGTDIYMLEYGLGVHEDYRRRGIATEILKARKPLMKALGIKHSLTVFDGPGSQKAGEKAGYVTRIEYR